MLAPETVSFGYTGQEPLRFGIGMLYSKRGQWFDVAQSNRTNNAGIPVGDDKSELAVPMVANGRWLITDHVGNPYWAEQGVIINVSATESKKELVAHHVVEARRRLAVGSLWEFKPKGATSIQDWIQLESPVAQLAVDADEARFGDRNQYPIYNGFEDARERLAQHNVTIAHAINMTLRA